MNNNNDNQNSRIPENDSSKPMNSKSEVENANDGKIDQDFPGYPHYPAKEDIMDQRTDMHRVDMDVENLSNSKNATGVSQRFASTQDKEKGSDAKRTGEEEDLGIKPGTEADVDEDDLAILNATNAEIGVPQNVANDDLNDLDIPGTELDDENEAIGEEDEENNYYSLGGDRHENLEEDQSGNL